MVSFLNSSYYLCSIDFADTVVSSLTSNVIMYRTFIIYFNGTRKAKLIKLSWWRHEMEIFPRNWQFVQGIHRFSMKSPHKGQWRGALMFSLICARINHWVNNHEACWFETLSLSLWRHCNVFHVEVTPTLDCLLLFWSFNLICNHFFCWRKRKQ